MKDKWVLRVDMVSYDPNHVFTGSSSVRMNFFYDSEDDMRNAYMTYHSSLNDQMGIEGRFTIKAVEPVSYPIRMDEDDSTFFDD